MSSGASFHMSLWKNGADNGVHERTQYTTGKHTMVILMIDANTLISMVGIPMGGEAQLSSIGATKPLLFHTLFSPFHQLHASVAFFCS